MTPAAGHAPWSSQIENMSTTDDSKSDCGVYTITNSKTLKVYVGSSAKVKRRWADHRRTLLSGEHANSKLRNSAALHGASVFIFALVQPCSPGTLVVNEQAWIDKLDAVKAGYNVRVLAHSNAGAVFSAEAKRRMSEAQSGHAVTLATRVKIAASAKGRVVSEATKEKLRAARAGRVFSETTRKKMSDARKGKVLSAAAVESLRVRNTGRVVSQETKEKLRQANIGKKHSAETKDKISAVVREHRAAKKAGMAQSTNTLD